jgi:hypothetical protein
MDEVALITQDPQEPRTEEDDNLCNVESSYEEIEARLQQERLDYLRSQKQREDDDAVFARQFQDDELLQVHRDRLLREMKDEELARQLQAQEGDHLAQHHNPMELNLIPNDGAHYAVYSRSRGAAMTAEGDELFDGSFACRRHVDIKEDELLARALQEQEHEAAAADWPVTMSNAQLHDAHLARVMQQSERISAMRRNGNIAAASGQCIARQMSAPMMSVFSTANTPRATDEPPSYHDSQQTNLRFRSTADEEFQQEQYHGVVTLPIVTDELTEARPGISSARLRHRKSSRSRSCKQQ